MEIWVSRYGTPKTLTTEVASSKHLCSMSYWNCWEYTAFTQRPITRKPMAWLNDSTDSLKRSSEHTSSTCWFETLPITSKKVYYFLQPNYFLAHHSLYPVKCSKKALPPLASTDYISRLLSFMSGIKFVMPRNTSRNGHLFFYLTKNPEIHSVLVTQDPTRCSIGIIWTCC